MNAEPHAWLELEDQLHARLSEQLEEELEGGLRQDLPDREALRTRVRTLVADCPAVLTRSDAERLVQAVVDRVVGLGPLEPLLADPAITEIMVNDPAHVFIERDGRIEACGVRFRDEAHLRHVIDRIVAPLGRRIDESSPLVDARLPDGSRVNAIIPPLTLGGPVLTIRKFSRQPFTLHRLVELHTLRADMAAHLERCVRERLSIVVSGGTGSGKTSTLNALGRVIPHGERLITIEDFGRASAWPSALVRARGAPANIEGRGEIPIRTLVRNALRMRPDRIIVGEVRGGEAFDMLQAMNTGHRGSMTTLHANSPEDALIRLESMVLMAGFELPVAAIRRMLAGAVQMIVQQDRLSDGRRVVTSIVELERSPRGEIGLKTLYAMGSK